MPDVIEAAPLGRPGDHRQHRGGPLQGLDLRLFIDREDRRVGRRRPVQADHVADLVDQQRVRGDLEILRAPRLQPERPPDAVHGGRRDPGSAGQFPLGPVRGPLGHLFQGPHDHLLHLGVGDGARHARAGLIAQPVQPPGQEPGPPLPHGAPVDAQPRRDRRIAAVLGAGEHDPRPQRQPLPSSGAWSIPATSAARHQTAPADPACYHPYPQQTAGQVPRHHPTRDLKRNTTHVVMRKLKTGILAQRHVQEPRVPDRGLEGAAGQRGDPDRRPEIIETATASAVGYLNRGSWILRKAPGQRRAVRARRRRGSDASHHGGRTSSATRVGLSDGISGRRRHQRVPPAPPGRLGPLVAGDII